MQFFSCIRIENLDKRQFRARERDVVHTSQFFFSMLRMFDRMGTERSKPHLALAHPCVSIRERSDGENVRQGERERETKGLKASLAFSDDFCSPDDDTVGELRRLKAVSAEYARPARPACRRFAERSRWLERDRSVTRPLTSGSTGRLTNWQSDICTRPRQIYRRSGEPAFLPANCIYESFVKSVFTPYIYNPTCLISSE